MNSIQITWQPCPNEWNAYAEQHDSFYHRYEWFDVWNYYGLKTYKLAALAHNKIAGILPLIEQKSIVTGSQLVSIPWFDAAGILTDNSVIEKLLLGEAQALMRQRKLSFTQIRQKYPLTECAYPYRADKVLIGRRLCATSKELWDSLSSKVRNQVRKSEKSGLEVEQEGIESLEAFYDVYCKNMRELGSPCHHIDFFQTMWKVWPQRTWIFRVRLGAITVGAAWVLDTGRQLEMPWAASWKKYQSLCINHALYWNVMRWGCEIGREWFNFGRSTIGSGQYHFKMQWGAETQLLYWYFLSESPLPESIVRPGESKQVGWGMRLWKRLPLRITQILGPRFIAHMP